MPENKSDFLSCFWLINRYEEVEHDIKLVPEIALDLCMLRIV